MLAMADPVAAARNFLNALEKIPSTIDQYKAKNEVLEREIPQLQEIAGKVWKKEDELKQLKSELAALDRKIQLELNPPTQETGQEQMNGKEKKEIGIENDRRHQSEGFIRSNTLTVGIGVPEDAKKRSIGMKI